MNLTSGYVKMSDLKQHTWNRTGKSRCAKWRKSATFSIK